MPQEPAARPRASRGAAAHVDARAGRDHKAIAALADDLLPALIEKLAASGLGEIEIREGAWKARLRKPAGAGRPAAKAAVEARAAAARAAASEHGRADEARVRKGEPELEEIPIVAASPAVGVFQPRKGLEAGAKVRAGERIGTVDVLGVREDVVSPVDGVVGVSLAEAGEAVEYGQPLVRIELPEKAARSEAGAADREAAAVLGEA